MKDYSKCNEITEFYSVFEALITKTDVTRTMYYTDSNGSHNLVELEYEDFGPRSVNMIANLVDNTFEMRFENRFVTTDLRKAIKVAVKGYKTLALKHSMKQDLKAYFHKYYDDFPELFL